MKTNRYPLHRDESISPVFIVGSGRSGTTLLRRILVESEQLHFPPETYVLGNALERFDRNATRPWDELVRLVLSKFEQHKHFPPLGISIEPVVERLEALPEYRRSAAAIIDALYRFHAESIGYPSTRWGEKSPANTYYLDAISDVFPRARYIHIVRDGCDVVASMLKMGRYEALEDAALRWLTATEAARAFQKKHPDICIEIRYEDLVTQTDDMTRDLCAFLEIRFVPRMLQSSHWISTQKDMALQHLQRVLEPITTSRISTGRDQLNHDELQKLQSLIGPQLEEFGYEPCLSSP